MEKIHRMSCECSKSEVDLFTIPPTQTTIENGKWVEYFPLTNITDATPIQFHLQGSTDEYTDLSQSLLHLQVKVVNGDGTPLGDDAQVTPTNLFMHSLFSDVDMMLNDRLITPPTNTYPYRSILETLLTYGPAAKESQLTSSLFYKDTPGYMDDSNPLAAAKGNNGMTRRYEFIKNSKTLDMIGVLHLDMFFSRTFSLGWRRH